SRRWWTRVSARPDRSGRHFPRGRNIENEKALQDRRSALRAWPHRGSLLWCTQDSRRDQRNISAARARWSPSRSCGEYYHSVLNPRKKSSLSMRRQRNCSLGRPAPPLAPGPRGFRSLKEVGASAQEMPQQVFVAQVVSDAVGPRDLRVFPKIPDAAHKKPRVSRRFFLPGTRTFA